MAIAIILITVIIAIVTVMIVIVINGEVLFILPRQIIQFHFEVYLNEF